MCVISNYSECVTFLVYGIRILIRILKVCACFEETSRENICQSHIKASKVHIVLTV